MVVASLPRVPGILTFLQRRVLTIFSMSAPHNSRIAIVSTLARDYSTSFQIAQIPEDKLQKRSFWNWGVQRILPRKDEGIPQHQKSPSPSSEGGGFRGLKND